MKYIRTKDGRIIKVAISKEEYERDYKDSNVSYEEWFGCFCFSLDIVKQADTIEELIQIGDIVFYWQQSDDKEHCVVMSYGTDIHSIKYNAITKLLIPVGEDYKCVAKGYPSFNLIKGRRYLVSKGELELWNL